MRRLNRSRAQHQRDRRQDVVVGSIATLSDAKYCQYLVIGLMENSRVTRLIVAALKMSSSLVCDRHFDDEFRASIDVLSCDCPAKVSNDAIADGEPKSSPLLRWFCGEEGFEHHG